jgi:hypothetical protein
MESPLLWSSTQIGAKCAGNWLRRSTKLSNNSSNNLQSLEIKLLFLILGSNSSMLYVVCLCIFVFCKLNDYCWDWHGLI